MSLIGDALSVLGSLLGFVRDGLRLLGLGVSRIGGLCGGGDTRIGDENPIRPVPPVRLTVRINPQIVLAPIVTGWGGRRIDDATGDAGQSGDILRRLIGGLFRSRSIRLSRIGGSLRLVRRSLRGLSVTFRGLSLVQSVQRLVACRVSRRLGVNRSPVRFIRRLSRGRDAQIGDKHPLGAIPLMRPAITVNPHIVAVLRGTSRSGVTENHSPRDAGEFSKVGCGLSGGGLRLIRGCLRLGCVFVCLTCRLVRAGSRGQRIVRRLLRFDNGLAVVFECLVDGDESLVHLNEALVQLVNILLCGVQLVVNGARINKRLQRAVRVAMGDAIEVGGLGPDDHSTAGGGAVLVKRAVGDEPRARVAGTLGSGRTVHPL